MEKIQLNTHTATVGVIPEEKQKEYRSPSVSATSASSTKNNVGKELQSTLSGRKKWASCFQMVLSVLMPVLAVTILCVLTVQKEVHAFQTSQSLRKSTAISEKIGKLVTQLQKERGMSCVYLSAQKFDDLYKLIKASLKN